MKTRHGKRPKRFSSGIIILVLALVSLSFGSYRYWAATAIHYVPLGTKNCCFITQDHNKYLNKIKSEIIHNKTTLEHIAKNAISYNHEDRPIIETKRIWFSTSDEKGNALLLVGRFKITCIEKNPNHILFHLNGLRFGYRGIVYSENGPPIFEENKDGWEYQHAIPLTNKWWIVEPLPD